MGQGTKVARSHRLSTPQQERLPQSDLMTGLMMVFLLVAIVYMVKLEADSQVIKEANVQIAAHSKKLEEQQELDNIKRVVCV